MTIIKNTIDFDSPCYNSVSSEIDINCYEFLAPIDDIELMEAVSAEFDIYTS